MGIKTENRILCEVDNDSMDVGWGDQRVETAGGVHHRLLAIGIDKIINPENKGGTVAVDWDNFDSKFELIPKVPVDISELEKFMEGTGLKVVGVLE